MSAIDTALSTLFADPNIARDATFTPAVGDPVPVRVVARRPDRVFGGFGETQLWASTTLIDVRVADVPAIARGDGFAIDGVDYVVQGEPVRDAERLVWTVEAVEA